MYVLKRTVIPLKQILYGHVCIPKITKEMLQLEITPKEMLQIFLWNACIQLRRYFNCTIDPD